MSPRADSSRSPVRPCSEGNPGRGKKILFPRPSKYSRLREKDDRQIWSITIMPQVQRLDCLHSSFDSGQCKQGGGEKPDRSRYGNGIDRRGRDIVDRADVCETQ